MENYINNFGSFKESVVYNFEIGNGGIADCIKYFMYTLKLCIINNQRLYYKKNNIEIENHIKLIYDFMYINDELLEKLDNYTIVRPQMYYYLYDDVYEHISDINNVFYFSNEIIENSKVIFPPNINNYISIHLRLGDKFLEIPKEHVHCIEDERKFSEEKLYETIGKNINESIFFCCDNQTFKNKLKEKYNNINITTGQIGHTSFSITSKKEILDTLTEFYLLTKSKQIYAASMSGFSIIASKFNNIPFTLL